MSTQDMLAHATRGVFNSIMDTIGKRIKHARLAAGLTQEQLAHSIGAAGQSTIGNYERDTNEPDLATIEAIASATGVDFSELVSGVNRASSAHGEDTVSSDKYAFIRVFDVQGGAGRAREVHTEEVTGTHAYRKEWLEKHGLLPAMLCVAEADGESMYPTINKSDMVLINRAERKLQNGRIFAFRTEDGLQFKRLFRQMDGRVKLSSDNPDKIVYPDEWLTPSMEAEIIGTVVHRSGRI